MSESSSSQAVLRIGRYELFDELASGGMATVHIGRLKGAVGFSRMVAIKRLHTQFLRDRQFVTMFVDEARLAARIRHPNVVPIIDVVQTNEELFLVMEYVQGVSLARAAALGRKHQIEIPIAVATGIVVAVLHGLHAAHEAKDDHGEPLGIVHRDVSPQNVLIGADGVARVLDFGIAKARGRLHDTAEGVVKGKLAYMAPEQISGADLGREADIYAAGVILWELLAGRRLHAAATETQVLASVLHGAHAAPSKHRPDVPEALDALVMRSLSLDAGARFATARELALALEDLLPIASAAHVARWVEHVADDVLQRSAVMVASVDSRPGSFIDLPLSIDTMLTPARGSKPPGQEGGGSKPPSASSPPKPSAAAPPVERTVVATVPDAPEFRWSRKKRAAFLGLVALFGGALLVLLSSGGSGVRREDARAAASAPPPPAAAAPTAAAAPPSAIAASTATATSATSAAPSAPASKPEAPVRVDRAWSAARRPASRPITSSTPVASTPPPAPARTSCDPPYTIDSRGVQRIKPQCL